MKGEEAESVQGVYTPALSLRSFPKSQQKVQGHFDTPGALLHSPETSTPTSRPADPIGMAHKRDLRYLTRICPTKVIRHDSDACITAIGIQSYQNPESYATKTGSRHESTPCELWGLPELPGQNKSRDIALLIGEVTAVRQDPNRSRLLKQPRFSSLSIPLNVIQRPPLQPLQFRPSVSSHSHLTVCIVSLA